MVTWGRVFIHDHIECLIYDGLKDKARKLSYKVSILMPREVYVKIT